MPFVNTDFKDDLPNRVDIVDIINRRVSLKKAGKEYKACCPFHHEKTPSFSVSAEKQVYICFGCGEGGGVINFVMKFDNLGLVEAIETIAGESGISVVYDENTKPVDSRLARYRDLMQRVGQFYIQQLKQSPAKDKAVNYAKNRDISGEIAKRFELGFAPPSSNLLSEFEKNDQNIADLKAMGLLGDDQYRSGQYYDFFKDRLMFPIHNAKGNIIAFGGRAFDNNAKAKYLNSPETPIFSKSKELYGLYHARKYSRSIDYILVVEGYMDVVALHQAGISQVVAALGTATTIEHLNILSRTTNTIIFCFDGDKAGKKAAWQALNITLPVIKAGMIVKFLFLPDGEDPDTLVKKEPSKVFVKRVENAQLLSQFLFSHIKAEVDFGTIEGKTLFLEKVSALLGKINYETYQQQLLEGLADEVKQSVEQVKSILDRQDAPAQTNTFDMPPNYEEPPMADFYDSDENYQALTPIPTKSSNSLIDQMIGLLLNHPSMVDETIELRVREINDADVLQELANSALLQEDIALEGMIEPFPQKKQQLLNLYNKKKVLKNYDYKGEFLDALLKIEEKQKQESALLITNEAEYTKSLQARKGKLKS
ncbi:DNA primase [Abyssogena phaseoliformis symbiont OG214]|uniref:DNA primase n=1 Tax=Abyssogena phaseoliformis symbiont TaxID=596095 RepID=UPI0019152603|nr:DNA primase [Abyssogena phaseoliformis symbiont]MBW5289506.1 DNA primase [Candidatus Ruthia sp. Apha_13_S6]BBB22383.1 DNA primase [Abyssogena phaseoliformis symbiont OG214]